MEKLTRMQMAEKYDLLAKRYEERCDELSAARTGRREAEEKLKESREHFSDLKERLSHAQEELSRLRGYLGRVHEDDVVRDGMVEIEDGQGKRAVPRRPPPMQSVYRGTEDYSGVSGMLAGNGRKRTHWTSY